MENQFDIAIIGGGLGGLECGVILSRHGYNVCVLEQGTLFGGCLQSFCRDGVTIDSGVHFVGSMGQGQLMRQYMKYLGVWNKMKFIALDDQFDVLNFASKSQYTYHKGMNNFCENLAVNFPNQRDGLRKYCKKIEEIGSTIGLDCLKRGKLTEGGLDNLSVSASEFIAHCVDDPMLRSVLAGTNVLYGGQKEASNLYHHAIINHSNIEGPYRFVDSTGRMADLLVEQIRANGGTVRNRSCVEEIEVKGAKVTGLKLENGEVITAKTYISNISPISTFEMVGQTPVIKKAYKTRLRSIANTHSVMTVLLKMKPGQFKYLNYNSYFYNGNDSWDSLLRPKNSLPGCVLMSARLDQNSPEFSEMVTLMSLIEYDNFDQWSDTTVGRRGEQYEQFKTQCAQKMINVADSHVSGLEGGIEKIYSASPLTYRDYTKTPCGASYGLLKDYRNSMTSLFSARTKLENLLLTGQNLNVHGVLGVTISAAVTCAELLGEEYLALKIGNL